MGEIYAHAERSQQGYYEEHEADVYKRQVEACILGKFFDVLTRDHGDNSAQK